MPDRRVQKIRLSRAARGTVAAMLPALAVATFLAWRFADLENWGEDEAGNLWLASDLAAGQWHTLGLVSSTGMRNMLGAPLLALPLSTLPDLLAIGRVLAIAQLLALLPLAFWVGRTPGERAFAAAVLWLHPALLLSGGSLWNQYLVRPLAATIPVLLLALQSGRGSARMRAVIAATYLALVLFEPAVHLLHFADLVVHLGLLALVMTRHPAPFDRRVAGAGATAVVAGASVLYLPLLLDNGAWTSVLAGAVVGAMLSAAAFYRWGPWRRVTIWLSAATRGRLRALPFALVTWAAAFVVVAVSLVGSQAALRMLVAGGWMAAALIAAQLALALTLLPALLRVLRAGVGAHTLARVYGTRAAGAALLLGYAGGLVVARLAIGIWPWRRPDLWVSLTPVLLAPLLLVPARRRWERQMQWTGVSLALVALAAIAIAGPAVNFGRRPPILVPPSEMCAAVDWLAARHRAAHGSDPIDLSYDLALGKEWIPANITWRADLRWYSIGRPYDWLLRRRHGLRNAREGEIDRTAGGYWQLGFRGAPHASDWEVVHVLDRLEIRRQRLPALRNGRGDTVR